jgi:hypothetical protein
MHEEGLLSEHKAHVAIGGTLGMYKPFGDDLPKSVNIIGILFVLIAILGWAFLGWG